MCVYLLMSLNNILAFSVFKHLVADLSKDKGTEAIGLYTSNLMWLIKIVILLYPF